MELPKELNEISGLTTDNEGFIYTHDDEKSIIYKIDYKDGKIVSKISFGKPSFNEDFEDIEIVDKNIWLVSGNGKLYKMLKTDTNIDTNYEVIKTVLGNKNDVEGLCYDEANKRLLLACKGNAGKGYNDEKGIYAFDLQTNTLSEKPVYLISLKELDEKYKIKDFSPSGIKYNKFTGTFFIISANVPAIIEMDKQGNVIDGSKLPKRHQQPEGITFSNDGELLISDESAGKTPKITVYRKIKN